MVAANPGVANPTLAQFVAGAPRTGDLSDYRTLLPRGDTTTLNASLARDLNSTTKGTVSLNLVDASSFSYGGLPGVTLIAPAGRNGSPFNRDVAVYRYLDDAGALTRDTDTTDRQPRPPPGRLHRRRLALDPSGDLRPGRDRHHHRARPQRHGGPGGRDRRRPLNPFGALSTTSFTRLTDTRQLRRQRRHAGSGVHAATCSKPPAGGLYSTFKFGARHPRPELRKHPARAPFPSVPSAATAPMAQ